MATTAALTENSRQGINFPIPPCTGPEAWLSPNPRPGCGHAYDETPVGLVVYVRNDPVNFIDPDGRSGLPVIILAGGAIGAGIGAFDAYWAGEPIPKGILSGALGGVAGAMTLLTNPYISGATAGFVSSVVGHAYDWVVEGQDLNWSDGLEIGIDTAAGAAIGRIVGDPTNIKYPGLIRARPGPNPNPFRTSKIGPKTEDAIRSFGLAASLAGLYSRLRGGIMLGGGTDSESDNTLNVLVPPAPRTDGSSLSPDDLAYQLWLLQAGSVTGSREAVSIRISYTGPFIR